MFIDVGCNHPIEYNNTYLLYLRGRHGINIDGNKQLIELYKNTRKGDISLNYLISDKEQEVVFNISPKNRLSTIENDSVATSGKDIFPDSLKVTMKTKTLNSVLEEYWDKFNKPIDLLCIDVEGHDFEVLSSIDLDKYKPYLIVVEMHDFDSYEDCFKNNNYKLLKDKGYSLAHYVLSTGYFIRNEH